jgi:hypothetical protein
VIWTLRDIISKFKDLNVHFESLRNEMTPAAAKFEDRRCILLLQYHVTVPMLLPKGD